jgi:hypothetical protein
MNVIIIIIIIIIIKNFSALSSLKLIFIANNVHKASISITLIIVCFRVEGESNFLKLGTF